jgi:hypothetical protein
MGRKSSADATRRFGMGMAGFYILVSAVTAIIGNYRISGTLESARI